MIGFSSRMRPHPMDQPSGAIPLLYSVIWSSACFSKLKQFRRVATRFEKTARHFLTVVTLAATILRLR
jgi:putative transposase